MVSELLRKANEKLQKNFDRDPIVSNSAPPSFLSRTIPVDNIGYTIVSILQK